MPSLDLTQLGGLLQEEPTRGLSAHHFNEALLCNATTEACVQQLRHVSKEVLVCEPPKHLVLCHERVGDAGGHWWSFLVQNEEASIYDSACAKFETTIPWGSLSSALDASCSLTFFELRETNQKEALDISEAYHLLGSGCANISAPRNTLRTQLKSCAVCGACLYPKHKCLGRQCIICTGRRQSCISL